MKKIIGLTFLATLTLFVSCKKIDATKGTPVDHTIDLTGFTGIKLSCSANITYVEEPETSVVIKASDKVFEAMKIIDNNGVLEFGFKNGYIISNANEVEIEISAPNIDIIKLSGSGNINADFDELITKSVITLKVSGSGLIEANDITADKQILNITGSGNIESNNVLITKTNSNINGSGNIISEGVSVSQSINVSGSGNFQGFKLITENTNITSNGSGDTEVTADISLDIDISGSGSVYYKGSATPNVSSNGSGSVVNAN